MGNVALTPEATVVTKVLVTVLFETDCKEAGQFTRPVDRHAVARYVISVDIVVVVKSSLAVTAAPVADAVALAAVVGLPEKAQASAMVVNHNGVCVLGAGPHE